MGTNLADNNSQGDQKPLTAAQFTVALTELKNGILDQAKRIAAEEAAKVVDAQPPKDWTEAAWRIIWLVPRIFGSGVFFISLGAVILYIASSTMGPAHSAFTFILVVLGVAIMLYGTGTQGMGSLQSTSAAAKYNIAIAGGAGVLAFCVAYGIIWKQEDIKSAFQVEKKYVRVPVMSRDGRPLLDFYLWEFSIDGVGIPAQRQGNYLEILVPYFATEFTADTFKNETEPLATTAEQKPAAVPKPRDRCLDSHEANANEHFSRKITASYQLKKEKIKENAVLSESLKPNDDEDYSIKIVRFAEPYGGYEFPKYPWYLCIDVKSHQRAASDAGIAGAQILPKADDAQQQAIPKAPAIIPTGGTE
jgi:hypothetical protein